MPMYMCRWENGDLSFVYAADEDEAVNILDELGDAEDGELKRIDHFMMDFEWSDEGDLRLAQYGELTLGIVDETFPGVFDAVCNAPTDDEGHRTPKGKEMVLKAVNKAKSRRIRRRKRKAADTEIGRLLQSSMGVSAAVANKYVEHVAKTVLTELPKDGTKQ
jgi:hypothetical protein